jgi:hypothetical protein
MLTRSRKRLYKVLLIILKTIIFIGAARKTRLLFPTVIIISCILVYIFRNINIFFILVFLLIFRNNYKKEFFPRLISLV